MENISSLIKELESLPKGYISKKNIKGKIYFYLQYIENGKIKSIYLKKDELDDVLLKLKRRQYIEEKLKQFKKKHSPLTISDNLKSFTGYLMMGDIQVGEFSKGNVISLDLNKCPLYIKRTNDISSYFKNRILDLTRPNARVLLKVLGILNKEELVSMYCYGACISDNYWFKPKGSNKKYSDIAFDNDLYSDLALEGKILQLTNIGSPSPELTNTGSFEKCWKYIDGLWWMYKKGNDDQIFSEIFTSSFASLIGVNSIKYEYDNGYVRSQNFADRYNFEPLFSLMGDNEDYNSVFNVLYSIGESFALDYLKLLWLDVLTYNVDRHNNNIGFLRNKKTGAIISLAPNFDNNLSLVSYNKTLDQDPNKDYLIKIFLDFLKINKNANALFKTILMEEITKKDIQNIINNIPVKVKYKNIDDFILKRYQYIKSKQAN